MNSYKSIVLILHTHACGLTEVTIGLITVPLINDADFCAKVFGHSRWCSLLYLQKR